jgi:DNA repair protein RecN (Recombination protein N)
MLLELVVENYAVVEKLRVRFHPGLNLLTGETGSGKSIVVDSFGLLLGGRASAEMIRSGAARARVSGIFEKPRHKTFAALLDEAGLEATDEDELLVEREIQANGKSRAFLDSRPVTASLLKDLAPFLGDIHGQHDQQRLFARDAQLELLDEFGLLEDAAGHVADLYQRWRQAARDLEELDRAEQERLRLADLWAFQRREIEAVAPHPGEDDALEQEKRVLSNVNRLAESASAAYEALFDAPESCMTSLRAALRKIDDLCRIDPSLGELRESLNPAEVAIEEASRTLRDYLSKLEADPGRLEEIESRLSGLDKLKRKYGRTIEEVLVYLNDLGRQLQDAETAGARREELKAAESKLVREFEAAAQSLSEARRRAAAKLEKRVEQELAQLAMARSVFEVAVTRASAPSASGVDEVAFLLSPNPGEEPKPMERIASGGELSRVALALKTVINEIKKQTSPPTLVFDEVDAGIGGSVAESVGRRLKLIAAQQQVLCVTHSAQIAGFADHHYAVEKREHKGRITTAIEELARDARVRELARMMAGSSVTPEVLKHAEQMISR